MGAAEILAWLGDVALRASIPLGLAFLLSGLFARRAARLRQAAWTLGVAAALAIPILSWAPGWHVAVLPSAVTAPQLARPSAPVPVRVPANPTLETVSSLPRAATSPTSASPVPDRDPSAWSTIFLVVWSAGLLLGLARLGLGLFTTARLARRAQPSTDPRAQGILARLGERLRLPARTTVLVTDEIAAPLAFGWLRPRVLLPRTATDWSVERLEVVLAHELVHVHRRDWPVQLAAGLTRAFYWFHPLVRLACKRLAVERERSCDEAVLALGATPSVYARHLLDIALGLRERPRLGGEVLAMAHRTQLEGRLMSILEDAHRGRRGGALLAPLTLTMVAASGAVLFARTLPQEAQRRPVQPPVPAESEAEPERTEYSYYAHKEGNEKHTMRISGRMRGLQEQRLPVWRVDPRVQELFREALPVLEELRPYEAQLDVIRAEMEPFERQLEELHAEMEPFHARLEKVHAEMEPMHEHQSALHEEMEPLHERMQGIHDEMGEFHERQEELHRRMKPFHERQERIHREMEGVHERMEKLHEQLEPLHRDVEKVHDSLEPLQKRLATLKPSNSRFQEIQEQIEKHHAEIERIHRRMQPVNERIERLQEELAPFHRRLETVHEEMEPIHELLEAVHRAMEPFHRRLEKLHEEMEPFHRRLDVGHEGIEPFHERMEAIHAEMGPLHERMEAIQEELAPFHERMEPIHEAMEPFWERLEPLWERMGDVLLQDLRRQWEEAVETQSFADSRVRGLLLDETSTLVDAVSWGWAVSHEPWHLRLHGSQRSIVRELGTAASALIEARGWAAGASDKEALDGAVGRFAETLPRVRYRL